MMKIYLAHNFAARLHLRELIKEKFQGFEITSRWIFEDKLPLFDQELWALVDVEDIERADCLLMFVDNFGDRPGRGKYWEWGYAVGRGKLVVLVGRDTNCVFWFLPERQMKFKELDEAIEALRRMDGR